MAAPDLRQLVSLGARRLEPVVGVDVGALEGGVVCTDLDGRHLLVRLRRLHGALGRTRRLEHSLLLVEVGRVRVMVVTCRL